MAASREMRAESSVKLTVRHRLDVSMSLFGGSCTIQLLIIVELNVHFTDLKRHLKFQYQRQKRKMCRGSSYWVEVTATSVSSRTSACTPLKGLVTKDIMTPYRCE
jgi:hypothetical protein